MCVCGMIVLLNLHIEREKKINLNIKKTFISEENFHTKKILYENSGRTKSRKFDICKQINHINYAYLEPCAMSNGDR
jgi:hypothetical protein